MECNSSWVKVSKVLVPEDIFAYMQGELVCFDDLVTLMIHSGKVREDIFGESKEEEDARKKRKL